MPTPADAADPRDALSPEDLSFAAARVLPQVARPGGSGDALGIAACAVGALALGAVTLVVLSRDRTQAATPSAAAVAAPARVARPIVVAAPAEPAPAQPAPTPAVVQTVDAAQSRAMPLIVDTTGAGEAVIPPAAAAATPAAGPAPATQPALLTMDEQFSNRVGGEGAPVSRAVGLSNPSQTLMQGAVIPAVLETALNSDLPGYARAIVSRDMRGFDGTRVVIPRGSRLIGQYKSGLATGQSRAFIVWTRLIRPDGVSIQLGSPVMDESGQIGLTGKVDRHFLQRFGSAILLSVVSGVAGAVGGSSSTVVVGTSSEAQSAAAMALQADGKIPPTIRIPLATPIQVFSARDLDFSVR